MQLSISESVSLETGSTTSIIIKYLKVIGKHFHQIALKSDTLYLSLKFKNQAPKCFEVTLSLWPY